MSKIPEWVDQTNETLRADNATLRAALKAHAEEAAKLIQQRDELLAAATAVVKRWESPYWKYQPHTGEYIDLLRAAIFHATTTTTE